MSGRRVSARTTLAVLLASALLLAAVPALGFVPSVSGAASSTHPVPTTWYSDDSPAFAWDTAGDLPKALGSFDTSGNAFDVAVAGNVAYVADQDYGVHMMDVSEPGTPTLLGTYDTPGRAREVVVVGSTAYVADRHGGLQVLDVSQPGTPTALGSYATSGYALAVAVSGTTAYIADQTNGLIVVDVSDPTAPALLGSYDTTGTPRHVAISGRTAYVAHKDTGLQVIDVSDPTSPTPLGIVAMPDDALGVAVSGDTAYVAAKGAGLQVVDVSDISSPTIVGSVEASGALRCVDISGDAAYVADKESGYMHIIDVSEPGTPTVLSSIVTPGLAYGVTVEGETAYVADWESGLQTIQVQQTIVISPRSSYITPGRAFGIDVSGDAAYVADYEGGLQVFDISDPGMLSLLGSVATTSNARDIVVSGNDAFIAAQFDGLVTVDVTDPGTPALQGVMATPGGALEVDVAGTVACVADNSGGLKVADVSVPSSPNLLGTLPTTSFTLGVAMAGQTAYIADYANGLGVVDISQPGTPTLVGSYVTPGGARGVAISGSTAYVADSGSGLQILDVSVPSSPTLLGTYNTPDWAIRVTVSGQLAYVADRNSGLHIIDVSDPTSPRMIASYDTPGIARDVAVSGDMAYVADFASGLQGFDIGDGPFGYSYELDQSPTSTPDAYVDGTATSTAYVGQADGAHWFHVRAVGLRREAGDADSVEVRIDTTPPTTTSDALPEYSDPATITLAPVDALSGVAETYYTFGSAVMTGTTVPVSSPGTQTLHFWSVDQAGNVEPTQTVEFSLSVEIVRRGGRDRYAVAVDASHNNFPSSDQVILATSWTYADALSASGLAGCLRAPILVTLTDRLPAEIEAEIVRLGATKVTIVGGPKSVSPSIEQHLRDDLGLDVERIGGSDRYAVSEAIATRVQGYGFDDGRVFVASGEVGADALSLSPVVYSARAPLVLTRRNVVPPQTQSALESSGASVTVLAGGPNTVTDANLARMESMAGTAIERLEGRDRYAVAAEVARYGIASGISSYTHVGVANGADNKFADSLCGGPAVGIHGGVMTLTQLDVLPQPTRGVLSDAKGTVVQAQVFGGPKSVSESVVEDIRSIIE